MREFLALPFLLLAKGFAQVTSYIDSMPCICFSLREAEDVTEDNLGEITEIIRSKGDE